MCKQENIPAPLSQWRHGDGNHVEPVEEVRSEIARVDSLFQVAIRGGHYPDVNFDVFSPSQSANLTFLNHIEEFGLDGSRHMTNLIKEKGPMLGLFDQSVLPFLRVGISPLLGAKQFHLDKIRGNRGAVYLNEWTRSARTSLMDSLCNEALSCASFTTDQDT